MSEKQNILQLKFRPKYPLKAIIQEKKLHKLALKNMGAGSISGSLLQLYVTPPGF
jgi:hypothetical protein